MEVENNKNEIKPQYDFYIGVSLAVLSTFFNGTSPVVTKLALRRLAAKENATRATEGGHGYLKDWVWWAGYLCCKIFF